VRFVLVLVLAARTASAAEPCTSTQLAAELEKAPRTAEGLRAGGLRTKVLLTANTDEECRTELFRTFYEYAATTSQIDLPWLTKTFGPVLPTVWRDFFKLRVEADTADLVKDGVLTVPVAELRKRVRRWETFALRYPTFAQSRLAQQMAELCFRLLLVGTPKTNAFAPDGKLRPEVRTELEAYSADKGATRRSSVRTYLMILKRQSYQRSTLSEAYARKITR